MWGYWRRWNYIDNYEPADSELLLHRCDAYFMDNREQLYDSVFYLLQWWASRGCMRGPNTSINSFQNKRPLSVVKMIKFSLVFVGTELN
jgi:hypothetical protein